MCALVTGVLTCALPISCTGTGESFIRVGFGSEVDAQIRYRETTLANATAHALDAVAMLGGRGGCIAIDARGKIALPFKSSAMSIGSDSCGERECQDVWISGGAGV